MGSNPKFGAMGASSSVKYFSGLSDSLVSIFSASLRPMVMK